MRVRGSLTLRLKPLRLDKEDAAAALSAATRTWYPGTRQHISSENGTVGRRRCLARMRRGPSASLHVLRGLAGERAASGLG